MKTNSPIFLQGASNAIGGIIQFIADNVQQSEVVAVTIIASGIGDVKINGVRDGVPFENVLTDPDNQQQVIRVDRKSIVSIIGKVTYFAIPQDPGSAVIMYKPIFSGASLKEINMLIIKTDDDYAIFSLNSCKNIEIFDNELGNKYTKVDLSDCSQIKEISIVGSSIRIIDLPNSINLVTLNLQYCPLIDTLDVTPFENLEALLLPRRVYSINLQNCTKLKEIYIGDELQVLDLSSCKEMETITGDAEELATLNVSGLSKLTTFDLRIAPNLKEIHAVDCNNNFYSSIIILFEEEELPYYGKLYVSAKNASDNPTLLEKAAAFGWEVIQV